MKEIAALLSRFLHPPKWVLAALPPVVFTALIFVFITGKTESAPAYALYCMSAYSLSILLVALPRMTKRVKSAIMNSRLVRRAASSPFLGRYLTDTAFRGSVGIYQGLAVNVFYMIFRIVAGLRYASVWFISMAVYYLVLGGLRAYLIVSYRRYGAGAPNRGQDAAGEARCYRRTAWLLFLLNIPMGGMIVLMVYTNSGFAYPGSIIYLSALYTFYTMITSVLNLVKFRRAGSPILSAAKVLNFVSAMMSILGLQTAMIARFSSSGEGYRRLMNALTGGAVYVFVILIAVYMLLHSRKLKKEGSPP